MKFTRRDFLKGATTTAVLASSHVLAFAARQASAATGANPILVLVYLAGGNDCLNTLIPLNDTGAPQRSTYQSMRPDLAIPISALGPTTIDPDPVLGTTLALHPEMGGLWSLYNEGKVALINGVGYPDMSMSHFNSEDIWFSGNPLGLQGTGWVGRHMDDTAIDGSTRAISFGSSVNPTLASLQSDAIGVRRLDRFDLPDDERPYRDLDNRKTAWAAIYDRTADDVVGRIARSGANIIQKAEFFGRIETTGWGSYNESANRGIGRDMRQVASLLRHDVLNPGDASGLSFAHVNLGGFDTHSEQGSMNSDARHPRLLREFSNAMRGFQDDLTGLGIADRVVTLVYSEFGRRIFQNDSGNSAGTDHGAGGLAFLIGDCVNGGVHGAVPAIDDPDRNGNLRYHTDMRQIYASIIDDWLSGDHRNVLPGAPFTPLDLII
jgi:uncharacterized protein (DUF1501 family)